MHSSTQVAISFRAHCLVQNKLLARAKIPLHRRTLRSYRVRLSERHVKTNAFFQNFFNGITESKPKKSNDIIEETVLPISGSILDDTFLEGRPMARAYKGSVDGFSALKFHEKCDFKGPCLVVAVTTEGFIFGGFNPVGFASTDDYKDNFTAFLFYLTSEAFSSDIVILEKTGGGEAAVFDYARGGPHWGVDALVIGPPLSPVMGGFAGPESEVTAAGDLRTVKSRLGLAYAVRPDGAKSIFGKNIKEAKLKDVEVYYAPEIAALY